MVDVRIVQRAGDGDTFLTKARVSQVPRAGDLVDVDPSPLTDYRVVIRVFWQLDDEDTAATVLVARESEPFEP